MSSDRNETKLNEILGIVLLGLSALAAAAVYFDAAGIFGASLRSFVFGMGGATGYVIPVVLGVCGILVIAARCTPGSLTKRSLAVLALLLVISMWHMGLAPVLIVQGGSYAQFVTESYRIGAATHSGGGAPWGAVDVLDILVPRTCWKLDRLDSWTFRVCSDCVQPINKAFV